MKFAHIVLAAIFAAAPALENVALRQDKLEAVGASVQVQKVDGVEDMNAHVKLGNPDVVIRPDSQFKGASITLTRS